MLELDESCVNDNVVAGGAQVQTLGQRLFVKFFDQSPGLRGPLKSLMEMVMNDGLGPRWAEPHGSLDLESLYMSVIALIILNNLQLLDSAHDFRQTTRRRNQLSAILLRDCVPLGALVLSILSQISVRDCSMATSLDVMLRDNSQPSLAMSIFCIKTSLETKL
jgi:hypothetical protein